jgi:mRNA interferase HigB
MRIIALSTLRAFWDKYPDSEPPLRAWYALASRANWKTPANIKEAYRNASFTANNRVVFNVKGNDYRLVVSVRYDLGLMYVRFVGTHRQYDKIDVKTI